MTSWRIIMKDGFLRNRVYTIFGVDTFEEAKEIFLSKIRYITDGLLTRESILRQLNDDKNSEEKSRIEDGTISGQGIYDYD